jgi:hypothetical protein
MQVQAEKKPADLSVSGLNPIQGELEETGTTLPQRIIIVFFILVICDISQLHKAIWMRWYRVFPLSVSMRQSEQVLFAPQQILTMTGTKKPNGSRRSVRSLRYQ